MAGSTVVYSVGNSNYAPDGTGKHWWYATYTSNNNYDTSTTSACGATMPETTVSTAQPTLTVNVPQSWAYPSDGAIPGRRGGDISVTVANGSDNIAGTLTLFVTKSALASQAPATCGGTAFATFTVGGAPTYYPTGNYTVSGTGDLWWCATFAPSESGDLAATSPWAETIVETNAPTLTLGGVPNGYANLNTVVTPTARLTGASAAPTGTIGFYVSGATSYTTCAQVTGWGNAIGTSTVNANNKTYTSPASYTLSAPGIYWWEANYGGDANNAPASTATNGCGETVVRGAPTLTITATPGVATAGAPTPGDTVQATLTGSLGNDANATIAFYVTTNCSVGGTPPANGGTYVGDNTNLTGDSPPPYSPGGDWTPAAGGIYYWYATYVPDLYNTATTSKCGGPTTVQYGPTLTMTSGTGGIPATETAGGGSRSRRRISMPRWPSQTPHRPLPARSVSGSQTRWLSRTARRRHGTSSLTKPRPHRFRATGTTFRWTALGR